MRLGAGHRSGRSIVPRAATGERKTGGQIQEKVWPVIRSKNNAWCAGQNFSRNLSHLSENFTAPRNVGPRQTMQCITQKLKKICRKESVLFAQKNLIRFAIVQINSLVQENAIFSGKIKLRETASIFLIRASAANVEQYSSRKKSLRRTVQMSVPDELQIGAMQKEAAISRSRERIFTNIVYWLCSGIKKFARFVDQPNRFSFTIKTVQVKLNRRIMLWKIFKCFVKNAIANCMKSITASSTANSLCLEKSSRLCAFNQ